MPNKMKDTVHEAGAEGRSMAGKCWLCQNIILGFRNRQPRLWFVTRPVNLSQSILSHHSLFFLSFITR